MTDHHRCSLEARPAAHKYINHTNSFEMHHILLFPAVIFFYCSPGLRFPTAKRTAKSYGVAACLTWCPCIPIRRSDRGWNVYDLHCQMDHSRARAGNSLDGVKWLGDYGDFFPKTSTVPREVAGNGFFAVRLQRRVTDGYSWPAICFTRIEWWKEVQLERLMGWTERFLGML